MHALDLGSSRLTHTQLQPDTLKAETTQSTTRQILVLLVAKTVAGFKSDKDAKTQLPCDRAESPFGQRVGSGKSLSTN